MLKKPCAIEYKKKDQEKHKKITKQINKQKKIDSNFNKNILIIINYFN